MELFSRLLTRRQVFSLFVGLERTVLHSEGSGIASVTAGTVIDAGLGTNRIRITTSGAHNLNPNDIVRVAGTTVAGYNTTYTTNTLSIVSNTVFEIVPGSGGTPNFSSNATGGTINVLKEDTIVLGTLQFCLASPRSKKQCLTLKKVNR